MENKSLSYGPQICLNSNVPEYLCNHFTRSDHKHSTRTSTSGSVNIPALRTVQGQRSFGYTGSKDFNSLPVNLKSIKEYKYFKRETKEHFRNLNCGVMNIKCHINQIHCT